MKFDFTTTEIAILVLDRAPDVNNLKYSPIPGRIHLIKELFAIITTNIGKTLLSDLNFEPDNFGPFDESIFAALDNLHDANLIQYISSKDYSKIELTDEGKIVADQLWKKLKPEVQELFTYVKINYNHKSSDAILNEIYSLFPEMAKNSISKVAEKYKTRETKAC